MELNGYDLSRNLFDWSYEKPEKINTNHIALYFFIIEHCNRLGWKEIEISSGIGNQKLIYQLLRLLRRHKRPLIPAELIAKIVDSCQPTF